MFSNRSSIIHDCSECRFVTCRCLVSCAEVGHQVSHTDALEVLQFEYTNSPTTSPWHQYWEA